MAIPIGSRFLDRAPLAVGRRALIAAIATGAVLAPLRLARAAVTTPGVWPAEQSVRRRPDIAALLSQRKPAPANVFGLERGLIYNGFTARPNTAYVAVGDPSLPRPKVRVPRAASGGAIHVPAGADIGLIEGVEVEGGRNAVLIEGAGWWVVDCDLHDSDQHGWFCQGRGAYRNVVTGTRSHRNGRRRDGGENVGHGFSQNRGARDNLVVDCVGTQNVEDGAQQGDEAGGLFLLVGCRLDGNEEDGFDSKSESDVVAIDCTAHDNIEHGWNLGRDPGQRIHLENCSARGNGSGGDGQALNLDYGVTCVVRGGVYEAPPGEIAVQVRQVRDNRRQADALHLDMEGAVLRADGVALLIHDGRTHRVVDTVIDGAVDILAKGGKSGASIAVEGL